MFQVGRIRITNKLTTNFTMNSTEPFYVNTGSTNTVDGLDLWATNLTLLWNNTYAWMSENATAEPKPLSPQELAEKYPTYRAAKYLNNYKMYPHDGAFVNRERIITNRVVKAWIIKLNL